MQYRYFRLGSLLIAGTLALAGCSWGPSHRDAVVTPGSHGPSRASTACQWNPSSCMYKGSYEPGEDVYAEQEAARLNRAEASRLSRRLY